MATLALRALLAALATALLLSIDGVVLAQPEPPPGMAEDQRLLPYVEPGQRVDIGGRRINLHCAGSGAPTVILMAGLTSWSPVWYKTQPVIAQRTRVCAFDRASYGFSDPAPRPQILSDTVNDLHAVLKAAPIPGALCARGALFRRGGGEAIRATLAPGCRRHDPRRHHRTFLLTRRDLNEYKWQ